MRVVVLTVDQHGSQTRPDQVPAALDGARRHRPGPPRLPAHRRRRVPGRARRPGRAAGRARAPAPQPRPGTSGSASARSRPRSPTRRGPAGARRTSPRARPSPPPSPAPGGSAPRAPPEAARALESAVWLWAALLARRTGRGWEVADLVDQGLTYDETASRLGITQSAVSQRAAAAGIAEGRRARELVAFLARTALEGDR